MRSPEYQFGAHPRFADLEPALRLRRLTDPRPPTVPLASAGGPPPRMGVGRYPQPNGPRRPHCTIPTSAPFTIFADWVGSGTMHRFAGFWICGRALDGSLAAVTATWPVPFRNRPLCQQPAYTAAVQSSPEIGRFLCWDRAARSRPERSGYFSRQRVMRFKQPDKFRGPFPSLRHFPASRKARAFARAWAAF